MKQLSLFKKFSYLILGILIITGIGILFGAKIFAQKEEFFDNVIQVEAQYSPEFEIQLNTNTVTFTIKDYFEIPYSFDQVGIEKVELPNIFQKTLSNNSQIIIYLNTNKFQTIIQQLAAKYDILPEKASIQIQNGKLITDKGRSGMNILTDQTLGDLKSTLNNQTLIVNLSHRELTENTLGVETFYLQNLLDNIAGSNFWIRYKTHTVKIDGKQLQEIIKYDSKTQQIIINNSELETLLKMKLGSFETASYLNIKNSKYENHTAQDSIPDYDNAIHQFEKLISSQKIEVNNIIDIADEILPATTGDYAPRYVEIDLSQQQMYVWEKGVLDRTYTISSGARNLTPIGIFKIINKSENAWSPIYKKWMPYWMAFTYLNEYEAWLGFHELTYWFDESGNQVFEADDRIGTAVSGGCVRLGRGEAEEFYNQAEVGDPVVIHE